MPVPAEAEVAVRLGAVAARNRDVELGGPPHAVLVDVESLRLDARLDADPPDLVEDEEAPERAAEGECADGDEAERLDAELVEAAAVDEALAPRREMRREHRHRKEAARERAPDAGHPVHGDCADRIVDPDPLDEDHTEDGDHAGAGPYHDRSPRRDEPRGGGDRHERAERAVQHQVDVRLTEADPGNDDPDDGAGRGRYVRGQRDVAEVADPAVVDRERRARVEAEPAEPE